MEILNKINDKTWNAVEGYRFFNRLKNGIFFIIMEYFHKFHKEHIDTDFGFSLDLSTDMEECEYNGEFCFVLQCDIHLTDNNDKEIVILNHSESFEDIVYWTPVQISERIDDFIDKIAGKIESYERGFEKCEDLPF